MLPGRLMAVSHSVPTRPSTEKTRGVKFLRWRLHSSRYFAFFSCLCQARTVFEEEAYCELFSRSVTVGKGFFEGIPDGSGDGLSTNDKKEKRVTWAEIVKDNSDW